MLRFPRIGPRHGQRGTALIEFALVLPLLILLTFLVIDLARAHMMRSMLDQAAREGARTLAADSSLVTAATMAKNVAAAAGFNRDSVRVTLDAGAIKGDPVKATVSANFTWLYPRLLNLFGWTGGSTLRVIGSNTCRREWD
jgi:Flp pilus assembly protein TadG